MAQQCAVAGHIVGVVQERSNATVNAPAADQDHGTAGHTAAAENPVPVEDVSSPLKPVQTPNTAESRTVQVPVDFS